MHISDQFTHHRSEHPTMHQFADQRRRHTTQCPQEVGNGQVEQVKVDNTSDRLPSLANGHDHGRISDNGQTEDGCEYDDQKAIFNARRDFAFDRHSRKTISYRLPFTFWNITTSIFLFH